jgi:hypothetical protein
MKKKKSSKKNEPLYIPLHIYGIFDKKQKEITMITLDRDEIDMELALAGENENISECEFDITLVL